MKDFQKMDLVELMGELEQAVEDLCVVGLAVRLSNECPERMITRWADENVLDTLKSDQLSILYDRLDDLVVVHMHIHRRVCEMGVLAVGFSVGVEDRVTGGRAHAR